MVANRTREIRPSGMKRGAWGNVAYGGNVNPPRNRKGGAGNPPPEGWRAPVLSQPSDVKVTGAMVAVASPRSSNNEARAPVNGLGLVLYRLYIPEAVNTEAEETL